MTRSVRSRSSIVRIATVLLAAPMALSPVLWAPPASPIYRGDFHVYMREVPVTQPTTTTLSSYDLAIVQPSRASTVPWTSIVLFGSAF